MPSFFIPHGGGPCFFMDWNPADTWDAMRDWLAAWPSSLPTRPSALVVVSGHWEASPLAVTANPSPPLIYDYSGFPPHTYELTWPAPGNPTLAKDIAKLLTDAGLPATSDNTRGFDHGVFIPLKVAFPNAEIPTVQLSLAKGLDPTTHWRIGEALAPLRDQGVLIIGSGMSYHNMRRYHWDNRPVTDADSFDHWLTGAITGPASERASKLIAWEQAPGARDAHPREEHLIPLMVAAGAASGEPATRVFHGPALGVPISAYRFG